MNAREFGYEFANKLSNRLFHALILRPISEFSLKEIQQKDFLDKPNIGMKTWNEFVEIRNLYFNNWKKKKTNTKKTAMQELIDELEYKKNQFIPSNVYTESTDVYGTLKLQSELITEAIKPFYDKIFNAFIVIVQDKLSKEKQQMIDFAIGAYQDISRMKGVSENLISENKILFEDYYNQDGYFYAPKI